MFEVVKQTYWELKETILHNDVNTCILGIAGIGKSELLKEKYKHLVEKNKGNTQNILWISSHSYLKTAPGYWERKNHYITFEEAMYEAVKKYIHHIGWTDDIRPIGKKDICDILNAISEKGTLPTVQIQDLLNQISVYKNKIANPDDYIKMFQKGVDRPYTESEKHSFFRRYVNMQIQFKILDADDIKHLSTALISKFYKEDPLPYKYILVDDFQNMSHQHFDFLKVLSFANVNICMTGDFDQQNSKAEFSKNELLDVFFNTLNCKIFQSTSFGYGDDAWNESYGYPNILEDEKMNDTELNKGKPEDVKEIRAVYSNTLITHICDELEILTEVESEYDDVYDTFHCLAEEHECAIFYRQNATADAIKTELNKRLRKNIKKDYNRARYSELSLEEKIKQAGNNYCDLSNEYYSKNEALRYYIAILGTLIRNNPYDYYYVITHYTNINLSKYFWADTSFVPELSDDFQTNFRISNLHSFGRDLDSKESLVLHLQSYKIGDLQRKLFELKQLMRKDNITNAFEEIKSFFKITEKFKEMKDVIASIEYEIKEKYECINESKAEISRRKIDSIIVSTDANFYDYSFRLLKYEDAAGLNFKYVFLTDLIEGILPSAEALEEGNEPEERRLFYIAATRASKGVYLCYFNYTEINDEKEQIEPSSYLRKIKNIQ